MKNTCLLAALLLVCFLAGRADAQIGRDWIVPASSRAHTTRGKAAFHTDYLIYTGGWKHHPRFIPVAMLPDAEAGGTGPLQSSVPGYHPSDILAAYNIPSDSGSEAIAIIDAFDLPTNLNDFNTFSKEFGLPQETSADPTSGSNKVFQVVYPQGSQPTRNSSWDGEIALDIEWAHAVAPNAKIYLVECASDAVTDLLAGAQYAAQNLPNVKIVSMSFGISEDASETQFDPQFMQNGVTFLAAAGDTANVPTYPAVSPYVISVGGTTLDVSGGQFESEVYWFADKNNAGSAGPSAFEPRPSYQNPFASLIGIHKGNPDVAADANPSTGCAVYVSSPVQGNGNQTLTGWLVFGGTSLACPIVAAILDDRGNFSSSSFDSLSRLYSLNGTSAFRDIVSGNSGKYSAGPGYDLVTGLGSLVGIYLNRSLSFRGAALVSGVAISGVPDNVALKDDHLFFIRSTPNALDSVAALGATFTGSISGSSAQAGSVTVTGLCTGEKTQLLALNVGTGLYDVVGTLPLTYRLSTVTASIPNIQNYLSQAGTIRLQVSGVDVGTGFQFRLGIDQITVLVEGPIE